MAHLPEVPLTIRSGEPLDVTVPILDDAGVAVPAASITSARAQVRVGVDSSDVMHEWTTLGETPNATVTAGGIRLQATAAETLTWQTSWPTLYPTWDLIVVDTAGASRRLTAPSRIYLKPVLTR